MKNSIRGVQKRMNSGESNMNKVYWATDDETYNLDTLDEVIEHLLCDNEPNEIVGCAVSYGEVVPFNTDWIDADFVIDNIAERGYDEGGEFALDFPDVSAEAKEELETFLSNWQAKHCVANFWKIKNTKEYTITQEDVDNYFANGGE